MGIGQLLCQTVSIIHRMKYKPNVRRGGILNRYNGFDDRSCKAQFDDNLCKRHRPKE